MGVALNYQNILNVIDNIDAFRAEISEFGHKIDTADKEVKSAVETITVNYKEFLDKAMIIADSLKEYYVGVLNNVPIDVYGQEALTIFNNYPIFPKEVPTPVEPELKPTTKKDK